jgi:hypothetical protein
VEELTILLFLLQDSEVSPEQGCAAGSCYWSLVMLLHGEEELKPVF